MTEKTSWTHKELRDIAVTYLEKNIDQLEVTTELRIALQFAKDRLERLFDPHEPPSITFYKGWSYDRWTISEPILEKLHGDLARFVVKMPLHVAEELRNKFEIALVPAAIDATEAIVRATHALAGATIELTETFREIRGIQK